VSPRTTRCLCVYSPWVPLVRCAYSWFSSISHFPISCGGVSSLWMYVFFSSIKHPTRVPPPMCNHLLTCALKFRPDLWPVQRNGSTCIVSAHGCVFSCPPRQEGGLILLLVFLYSQPIVPVGRVFVCGVNPFFGGCC